MSWSTLLSGLTLVKVRSLFRITRHGGHMKRIVTLLAAAGVVAGAALFSTAALANSFAVSIGAPGFAVGYSNHGGYVSAYVPPPTYYAPPAYYPYDTYPYGAYYSPAPAYYGAPV